MDATHQAFLSIANSQSLFKLMSIELVMLSNHLILSHPLLLPPSVFHSIRSFPMSQFFASGGQSIGASTSASILAVNIQDWFPLGWTGWISLQSKGLSSVFSNTTVQKHRFFWAQLSSQSSSHIHTWPQEKPELRQCPHHSLHTSYSTVIFPFCFGDSRRCLLSYSLFFSGICG